MISSTEGKYARETLNMLCEVYEYVVRSALARRRTVEVEDELSLRRQLGEILLALYDEGENDPAALRREALNRFFERQKRS